MTETNLPDPNEPLVLADGTSIDPTTGESIEKDDDIIEVPTHSEAQNIVTTARRRLADIPTPPKRMNTIGVICFYELMGIMPFEIAYALNMTETQVKNIQSNAEYTQMRSDIVKGILQAESTDLQDQFVKASRKAFDRVYRIATKSGDEKHALAASRDILDRGGFRPADVIDHRHSMAGGLQIEYVNKDVSSAFPTIDITPNDDGDENGNGS